MHKLLAMTRSTGSHIIIAISIIIIGYILSTVFQRNGSYSKFLLTKENNINTQFQYMLHSPLVSRPSSFHLIVFASTFRIFFSRSNSPEASQSQHTKRKSLKILKRTQQKYLSSTNLKFVCAQTIICSVLRVAVNIALNCHLHRLSSISLRQFEHEILSADSQKLSHLYM